MMNNKHHKGFTLIEVMIVVGIIGVIASIAIPSYADYVKRAKRADAKVELLRVAQLQESYFVQNLSYAKDLTIGAGNLGIGADVKSEQEEYTITIGDMIPNGCTGLAGGANIPCTGYTLTATAEGAQAYDKCKNFTLTNTGVKGNVGATHSSKVCWK